MDRQNSRSVDRQIDGSVDRQIDGSVDRWISGSVDTQIGGSVDRWIGRSLNLQTAKQSVFSSKSVKKSVTRGVRVLCARTARASHARRECEAREKKPYFQRLSPVSLSVFSLVPDLLFDCSRVLEYAKIRTVLQSTKSMDLQICGAVDQQVDGSIECQNGGSVDRQISGSVDCYIGGSIDLQIVRSLDLWDGRSVDRWIARS